MSTFKACALAAVSAAAVLLAVAPPLAGAAPESDGQGYLNSTARCSSADATVVFGSTDASRVAICKTSADGYEYRGVRVRDGARLIIPAKQSGDAFVADNDGIEYTVSAKSVVVSDGNKVLREEQMVDFHGPDAPAAAPPATPTPAPPATPTPTTPLPPPLPAERGGG
jgi:hypothetical protein